MAQIRIPKYAKALVKTEDCKSYKLTNIHVPELAGDDVLIRVDAVGLCGTDIGLYNWDDYAKQYASLPLVPGHECAGTVIKRGPEADIEVGTKVGVENHYYCGQCYQCKHDRRENCTNMAQYGLGKDTDQGGCSEYSVVPQRFLYRVTTDLSPEQIVLLEPLGVAHNGVERLKVKAEDVLVIGCGTIGLLVQALAKAMGAHRVIGVDPVDWKIRLAKEMGTDIVINSAEEDLMETIMKLTDGLGVGRICDCVGSAVTKGSCFSLLRKNGRLVFIGLTTDTMVVENVTRNIVYKCPTLKTVHGRRIWHMWREAERLLAEGRVRHAHKVVTHRFPMSRFEEAFSVLMAGQALKIILDPSK